MKKIAATIISFILGLSAIGAPVGAIGPTPVFAATANTAILKSCAEDNGRGSSIFCVLNLVIDIMTIGVGILGVTGITIVGIQYLTAGGSEEKTRKAKRRMTEIIIGIAAYVVIYALLKWLLPNFNGTGTGT